MRRFIIVLSQLTIIWPIRFFKHHHFDLLGPIRDANYINALYDAEIRYLDDLIKELDSFLMELGIYEDTFMILFGDHGESLTEHQIFWDHCGLYDPTVRVPLIMRWPGSISPQKRVKGQVQQVDLMPTILDALHLPLPERMDGKSLWQTIEGKKSETHKYVYLSECAWQASRGLRTLDFKLIQTMDAGLFQRPKIELFNLNEDPEETKNLAEAEPMQVKKNGAFTRAMGQREVKRRTGPNKGSAKKARVAVQKTDRANLGRGWFILGGMAGEP